jgi:hypothetical protein
MSELMKVESQNVTLAPKTMAEAMEFAKMVANSEMVPKDYRNKPANALVAIQWGYEIGLAPMQALQNIAIINGRPAVYGDSMLALVKGSGVLESISETFSDGTATCTVKRRGEPEAVARSFSIDQAKKAGLWGKQGPWQQYPERMLQMRARAFALRDVFPDVLKGMYVAEEAQDIAPDDAPPPRRPQQRQPEPEQIQDAELVEEQPPFADAIIRKPEDVLAALKKQVMAEGKRVFGGVGKAELVGELQTLADAYELGPLQELDTKGAGFLLQALKKRPNGGPAPIAQLDQKRAERHPGAFPLASDDQKESILFEAHQQGMDIKAAQMWLEGYGYKWGSLSVAQADHALTMLADMAPQEAAQ